jgi:uncharacterized delta-60 repeat protein
MRQQKRSVRALLATASVAFVVGATALPASADPGDLDGAFGGDGQVTTPVGNGDAYGYSGALQSDGKLVVTGVAYNTPDDTEFAVARYKPNGLLDPTFGGDGKVVTNLTGGDDEPLGVVIVGGGKIVVAGNAGANFVAVRYLPDGTLDHSFSGDGKAIIHFSQGDSFGFTVGRSKGNKVVIGGQVTVNGVDRFALVRLTPKGALDASFGGDGRVFTTMGSGNAYVWKLIVHADASIVATGDAIGGSGKTSPAVAWYRPGGTLDSDFGDGGRMVHDVGEDLSPSGIVQLPSGKIVVAGGYRTSPATFKVALVRFLANGQPDDTFGPNALVTRDLGADSDYVGELRRQRSKLLLNVSHTIGDDVRAGVLRLNVNGSVDTAFGDEGLALSTFTDTFADGLTLAGSGAVYVIGQRNLADARFLVARFLTT